MFLKHLVNSCIKIFFCNKSTLDFEVILLLILMFNVPLFLFILILHSSRKNTTEVCTCSCLVLEYSQGMTFGCDVLEWIHTSEE